MEETLRVRIKEVDQRNLFKEFNEKTGSRSKSAEIIIIKENTYKNYSTLRTKYIPKDIINKIYFILKKPVPKILEAKTLKEIR